MTEAAEREAKRALSRLRRAVEKARRELGAVERGLREVGDSDFPEDAVREAAERLDAVGAFVEEQAERLDAMVLARGLGRPSAGSSSSVSDS